ncbi:UvrD-helicase domain-containing protein [Hydrogenophilus thiooxidans]|uniref:UvrD-helicase domain-containing protein n=1 Tax=Hydrogenophilus thiooxidans TaxID=2820326 RepID=UPI001C21BA0D|nr:UvrD-helicase domain-containing protein [Hydrogenophilus thiooxidans]
MSFFGKVFAKKAIASTDERHEPKEPIKPVVVSPSEAEKVANDHDFVDTQLAQAIEAVAREEMRQKVAVRLPHAQMTDEQRDVVESTAPFLAVNAYAGAGKTHTLKNFALARSDEKLLYVCFNRSLAEEAKRKMPNNVRVGTIHAICFNEFARHVYKDINGKFSGKPTSADIYEASDFIRLKLGLTEEGWKRFYFPKIIRLLEQFTNSDALDLRQFLEKAFAEEIAHKRLEPFVVDAAIETWNLIADPRSKITAWHDVYVKMWHLSNPSISGGYQYILLDEAQDVSPVMYDIFLRQEHLTRVLVGDRHQCIYGFRGAMNAMQHAVDHGNATEKYMTQSFRFGNEVALLASLILQSWKKETRPVRGNPAIQDEVRKATTVFDLAPSEQSAYLARTNGKLIDTAISLMEKKIPFQFLGEVKDYRLLMAKEVAFLKANKRDKLGTYLRKFKSYSDYKEQAEREDDQEKQAICRLVEKYGKDLPQLVESLERTVSKQGVVLTTAHKSKGAEWAEVMLADDFPSLINLRSTSKLNAISDQEANLYYVAVTRAQRTLYVPNDCYQFYRAGKRVQGG